MTQPDRRDERLADERLRKILAAAEKATPGPWEARTKVEWDSGFDFFAGEDGAFSFPIDLEEDDVAFINIARATLPALASELLRRREANVAAAEVGRIRDGSIQNQGVADGNLITELTGALKLLLAARKDAERMAAAIHAQAIISRAEGRP